jgi:hypothetical protein
MGKIGHLTCRMRRNTEVGLKEMVSMDVQWIRRRIQFVGSFCEHCDESSNFMQGVKFLEYLSGNYFSTRTLLYIICCYLIHFNLIVAI